MATREEARRLVAMHEIDARQRDGLRAERTVSLQGVPAGWACDSGGCLFAAYYALRSAMELGGTVIEIQRGQHRHTFDVADLLAHRVRMYGVPSPTRGLPRNRGLLNQYAVGNTIDRSLGPMIVVPETVSGGEPAASENASQGETSHG